MSEPEPLEGETEDRALRLQTLGNSVGQGAMLYPIDEPINRIISMVRAKGARPLHILKRQFGQTSC